MIEGLLQEHIDGLSFPGIMLLVQIDGKTVIKMAMGNMESGSQNMPITEKTLFDLASVTKPLATTTTFLALCEAQAISLDQTAGHFLSGLNSKAADISLTQLMTHTSGLPPIPEIFKLFAAEEEIDRNRALEHLYSIAPEQTPGQEVIYSCTGYILLTRILNEIAGCSLSEAFEKLITGPGRIDDLIFNPGEEDRKRAASTEYCPWRGRLLKGEVHDENSFCLGGEGGNAGLFGTADAVAELLELFSSEGELGRKQLLSPLHIHKMTRAQTGPLVPGRALGFLTQCSESFAGPGFSGDAFGHTGFTGTSVWMDNSRRLKVVALTNRVNLGREETAEKIKSFRTSLHQTLLKELF